MRRQNFQKGLRKQLPRKSSMSLLPRTHENAGHDVAHRQPQPWDSCGLPALPAWTERQREMPAKKKKKRTDSIWGMCLWLHTHAPRPYTYTCPHVRTHILKSRQLRKGTGKKTFKPTDD